MLKVGRWNIYRQLLQVQDKFFHYDTMSQNLKFLHHPRPLILLWKSLHIPRFLPVCLVSSSFPQVTCPRNPSYAQEISFADSHQVVQMYLHSCAVSTYCLKLENASNQADLTFYEYRYTGHWVWCPRQLGLDLHDRLCMDARETTRVASMRIQNPWRDKR